jgi:hypothetical protein
MVAPDKFGLILYQSSLLMSDLLRNGPRVV